MTARYTQLYGADGTKKGVPYPGFKDQTFTGGGATFTLTETFDADNWFDVWVDGIFQDPSAWSVTVGANTITLASSVASGRAVRVRIYLH
jgi:hypothetical protein